MLEIRKDNAVTRISFGGKLIDYAMLESLREAVIAASVTFERAKRAAPRYDVYWLEQEWRDWWDASGGPELDTADAAFVAFCAERKRRVPDP